MRRRERRRLAVAVISTVVAIPLLVVEVAPGADAAPDASPAAFVGDEVTDTVEPADVEDPEPDPVPRAVATLSGDDMAGVRRIAIFSGGDALRAQAEAEALEAEERERLEREAHQAAEEQRRAEAEALERAREEAERERQAEEAAPPPPPAAPGAPSPEQWHALRMCESSGNYQAVSRNGLYFGAYQFYPGTWDNTARIAGRGDLVGVRPDQASPTDQDAMAVALWVRRGSQPWPHCGVHLR